MEAQFASPDESGVAFSEKYNIKVIIGTEWICLNRLSCNS